MKILWVLASPIGNTADVLYDNETNYGSGHWIDYSAEKLLNYSESIELGIITTSNNKNIILKEKNGVKYYCLNLGKSKTGKTFSEKNSKEVQCVFDDFCPDVIHIWGSESSFGLLVAQVAGDIPSVVCIQGLIKAIAKYPNGGLTYKQLTENSVLDKVKYPVFQQIKRSYDRQVDIEEKLLNTVENVISESDWAFAFCKNINPEINCYWFPLQQNEAFSEFKWNKEEMRRHSIFCISGRGAYKGIHNAIKAFNIIHKKYPDAILYIPGKNPFGKGNFKAKLFQTPYTSLLKRIIKKHNLENHIYFTGLLSPYQMAEYLSKSNVFIMPSSIENQSSSLREALSVGVPSISAYVGCIDEAIHHNETGFIYRYEEFEVLAYYIDLIFKDHTLASKLSDNSRVLMNRKFLEKDGGEILFSIYQNILKSAK